MMSSFRMKLIKNDEEYTKALERIEELFGSETGTPESDEQELLVKLVELYEEEKYRIEMPDPVAAIRFRMEQSNLSQKDLIPYIGSRSKVSEVLAGKVSLSLNMIRNLHEGLGIPLEVLIQEKKVPAFPKTLGSSMPFAEMYSKGYFSPFFSGSLAEAKAQKDEILGKFLGSASTDGCRFSFNCQSSSFVAVESSLLAWRIHVMDVASREHLPRWRADRLDDAFFSYLVKLSSFGEGPRLAKEMLNKLGIHFVAAPHLEKTYLDGSSMLMPDGSPLVALTLRYDRLDSFWFTLFHELAHVKLHLSKDEVFFDDMDKEMSKDVEREASSFAREKLISSLDWKKSGLSLDSSPSQIVAFANEKGISPAIPVNRIRFESGSYKAFGSLLGRGQVRKLFFS